MRLAEFKEALERPNLLPEIDSNGPWLGTAHPQFANQLVKAPHHKKKYLPQNQLKMVIDQVDSLRCGPSSICKTCATVIGSL